MVSQGSGSVSHARLLLLLLAGGILPIAGCEDPLLPDAPPSKALTPDFAAEQSMERSSFFVDVVAFIDCLGEDVRFFGEVAFQRHVVRSAAEVTNVHIIFLPSTPELPFFAEGQESGILYQARGAPGNLSFHIAPGEVVTIIGVFAFVSEDGDMFILKDRRHLTVNANGDLVVLRIEIDAAECPTG